jgi:2-C-methyl-D-erythritol 4-phosphate cytidylyltransferase
MRSSGKKEFLLLGSRPILAHTLGPLEAHSQISDIILVVDEKNIAKCRREIVKKYGFKKVREVIPGGLRRQDSVAGALKRVETDCDIVLIQDGARPFVTEDLITGAIAAAQEVGAAVVAVPVTDTVKCARDDGDFVLKTVPRDCLWRAQTPQAFRYPLIREAYRRAREDGFQGTDDASLVERMGKPVKIVKGSYDNIKITRPQDLFLAEAILGERR